MAIIHHRNVNALPSMSQKGVFQYQSSRWEVNELPMMIQDVGEAIQQVAN